MRISLTDIKEKRHINPRFEVDSDYVDELMATDDWPAVIVTQDMLLVDCFNRVAAASATDYGQ